MRLDPNRLEKIARMLRELDGVTRIRDCADYPQHGDTSVLLHCAAVAYYACTLLDALHVSYDERSLLRGALLHDYFLYDWHHQQRAKGEGLHGFTHAATALRNAKACVELTPTEENVIARHMFPLNLKPPACREAWAVCLADKYCALTETLCRNCYAEVRAMCRGILGVC